MESTTLIISQSIDNFFETPDDYLIGIKEHIDYSHFPGVTQDPNCIIDDIVNFTKTFESIYLLDLNGYVIGTWPDNPDFMGIDMSNQQYFKETTADDKIYWSDTFTSTVSGAPTVALSTVCNFGIIIANYNLNQLENFVSLELQDEKDFIAVMDMKGNVVAHSKDSDIALQGNLGRMQSVKQAKEGILGTTTDYHDGDRGLVSISKAANSGFIVLVFKAHERIFRALYQIYTFFIFIFLTISVALIGIVLFFLKTFFRPMTEFQTAIQQAASGSYYELPNSYFIEFSSILDSFAIMVRKVEERETALKSSINERDTLLRELNHRTKNNMQLINGIMKLYSLKHPGADPRGIMKKIHSKIETISLVHERLYKSSDLSSINFREYIEELIPALIKSLSDPSTKINYSIDIEDTFLMLDYAIPCGLILNEFILNTLKYAFILKNEGSIKIKSRLIDETLLRLTYSDNGVGLPENFDERKSDSLGFSIINNIIKSQLYGKIEILPGEGFCCQFEFSLDTFKQRI